MQEDNPRKVVDHVPSIESNAETVRKIIEAISKRTGEPEYKTGLSVFDEGIFGLHKTMLTILAARAGQGKTSMAVQLAFNMAALGKHVAFISLEMSRESIFGKIFCYLNKIDVSKFFRYPPTPDTLSKLQDFEKIMAEIPLRVIDDYCFTQNELYTLIEHLEYRPEVLILDHLQHIRASSTRHSERENLSEYLRFLKELAMRYKMAVLCLSQINREGDSDPTIRHLKGSGSIEEMADHILILNIIREETALNTPPPVLENARVAIGKNRYGIVGYMDLMFEGRYGRFLNKA